MSLFNLFSGATTQQPAAPAAAPQQAPAAAQQAQQMQPSTGAGNLGNLPATIPNPSSETNPLVPSNSMQPNNDDPLSKFANLWDTAPNTGKPAAQGAPELTAEMLQQTMSKADFSRFITPENMAAITAGGEGAAQAFAGAMNAVVQQAMIQSTLIANKLTQQAVTAERERTRAELPELLRKQTSSEHLRSSNPLFSNPAVKPIIEATQAQLLQKYPNATNAEISRMAQDYVLAMSDAFSANNPHKPVPASSGETDWNAYLNS